MFVFIYLIFIISGTNAARILGYVPTPSYSHHVAYQSLWKELSLRGHHVTTITTHPINDSSLLNLTEIDLSRLPISFKADKVIDASQGNVLIGLRTYFDQMINVIDLQLEHPPVKRLIDDPNIAFDLVIGEYFFSTPFAFAVRYDCPSIGLLSVDALSAQYKLIGNPTHPVLYPDSLTAFGDQMTLLDRIESVIASLMVEFYLVTPTQRMEQMLVAKHFGHHYPLTRELAKNISFLFVTADPIFHDVKPLLPTVIQIGGGSHRVPTPPLSNELKEVLDSKEFIYFSLGLNVRSDLLPLSTLEIFVNTFAELPYTVLWKFEGALPYQPDNVISSKLLPQQHILKHPNIKLFITQGGQQSLEEAIFAHVPMIGVPFYADQPYNVKKIARKGIGLEINPKHLEKEHLKDAILEVINNPRYKDNVRKLAELARDQPMTGVEKAVWWSEYVIRHKGARHLRSALLDIPWYQYLLLDVICVLGLSLTALIGLMYAICKLLIRLCFTVQVKDKKN
ncbi:hypothetical protein RI129_012498 [Pyrocoelia pectoralis]|uniref:UDP-glucuronosyltransferase n=1 Tax=Pyrocoelia pectoralis TaxID=417401 RepID=A0AAN7UZG2_9COLE